MGGLKPVRVGNVLFVTSKANAKEIKADLEQATPPGVQVMPYDQLLKQAQIQQLINPQLIPQLVPAQPAQPPAVVPMDVPPVPVPPQPVEKEKREKDNEKPPPDRKDDK
jgi:hypothetical protein